LSFAHIRLRYHLYRFGKRYLLDELNEERSPRYRRDALDGTSSRDVNNDVTKLSFDDVNGVHNVRNDGVSSKENSVVAHLSQKAAARQRMGANKMHADSIKH